VVFGAARLALIVETRETRGPFSDRREDPIKTEKLSSARSGDGKLGPRVFRTDTHRRLVLSISAGHCRERD